MTTETENTATAEAVASAGDALASRLSDDGGARWGVGVALDARAIATGDAARVLDRCINNLVWAATADARRLAASGGGMATIGDQSGAVMIVMEAIDELAKRGTR